MSAYTTLYITESRAKSYIMEAILNGAATADHIARMLDVAIGGKLYNSVIVPDGSENDNAELGTP